MIVRAGDEQRELDAILGKPLCAYVVVLARDWFGVQPDELVQRFLAPSTPDGPALLESS